MSTTVMPIPVRGVAIYTWRSATNPPQIRSCVHFDRFTESMRRTKMGGGNTRAIAYQDFLVLECALNLCFTILRWLDNLTVLDQ